MHGSRRGSGLFRPKGARAVWVWQPCLCGLIYEAVVYPSGIFRFKRAGSPVAGRSVGPKSAVGRNQGLQKSPAAHSFQADHQPSGGDSQLSKVGAG